MNNNSSTSVTIESCILYIAGSSDLNKCNSGYAYAIIDKDEVIGPVIDVYSRFQSNSNEVKATLLALISGCKKAEGLGASKITIKTSLKYISNMINKNWIPFWEENNWIKSDKDEVKNLDLVKELYELTKRIEIQASFFKKNENDDIMESVRAESKNTRELGIISKTETLSMNDLGSKITTSKGDNPNNKSKRKPRIIEIKKRREKQKRKKRRKKNKYKV